MKNNLLPAWHGTKFEFLESIIKKGLKLSGSKLPDGTVINTLPGYYSLNDSIAGVKNWSRVIFVFPSIFYSSHACYDEELYQILKDGLF